MRGEIGGAEFWQLLTHHLDVGADHFKMRKEILGEVLAELIVGRDSGNAPHVIAPLQILGHDPADFHRREVGASDVTMPRLSGKTPSGGKSADHQNPVLFAEVAARPRRAAMDPQSDELDLFLEDHAASFRDRLFY